MKKLLFNEIVKLSDLKEGDRFHFTGKNKVYQFIKNETKFRGSRIYYYKSDQDINQSESKKDLYVIFLRNINDKI